MTDGQLFIESNPYIWVVYILISIIVFLSAIKFPKPEGHMRPFGGSILKTFFAYLMIKFGMWRKKQLQVVCDEDIDCRIPGTGDLYNDSFVFTGTNQDGLFFITRLGFVGDGTATVWLLIRDPKFGEFKIDLERAEIVDDGIRALGLEYTCLEPGKKWAISYDGDMIDADGELKHCSVDLEWTATSGMYHSGLHLDHFGMAKAMSEMIWVKGYFDRLKSENQTRIEQGGDLEGVFVLDGVEKSIKCKSVRDHSWGKRNWTFINRYVWFAISLDDSIDIDGDQYDYVMFMAANYGTTFSHLVGGWIAGPNGAIRGVSECSDIRNIGDDGEIPKEFAVRLRPVNGPILTLSVRRSFEHSWFMQDDTFNVSEGHGVVDVDGCRGSGIIEFGYSKDAGYDREWP